MKILLVNGRGYPEYGCENYFSSLHRLLELKGHKVILFTAKDRRNTDREYSAYCVDKLNLEELDSVPWIRKLLAAPGAIYSFASQRKIARLIKDTRPDIAHLHNIKRSISPSILGPLRKSGIPVVQTLHDYRLICPNYRLFVNDNLCEECKNKRYYRAVLKRCVRNSFPLSLLACLEQYIHHRLGFEKRVDVFISPANFLKQKMQEFGFNPGKLICLPNFVFAGDYQPDHPSQGYIVCFGRLVQEKGIATVIEAMRGFPAVKLLILGDGEYRKKLESIAAAGNMRNVEFRGFLTQKEIRPIIEKAMFTIVASRWYEVCPMVILESFAMGKPVIGAKIGGITELIADGVNGFLFSPGNSLELSQKIGQLLREPGKIAQMGQAARRKAVEEYGADLHYQRLLNIYESLLPKEDLWK